MPSIFAVNENNDIYANGINRLALKTGIDAVLQNCEHVVKTWFGEIYHDRTRGVDYLGNVFSSNPNILAFEADARRVLSNVAEVRSIPVFDTSLNAGILTYSATIQTTYGSGTISGEVDGLI